MPSIATIPADPHGASRDARRRGPVPPPLGDVLAALYAATIRSRNRAFDRGKGVVRIDRPVISVGNLSVGGTGKTPMVATIVQHLRDLGRDPCIAMRGYGARDGQDSDEAQIYSRRFEDLPIVAQPNRLQGLLQLFGDERGERVDAVVLDDGFQHRRIARDLDVVLIDATRSPFEDRLLPAGWLREPVASLRRCGMVFVTHAQAASVDAVRLIERRVSEIAPGVPIGVCRHIWGGLLDDEGRERRPGEIRGRRVAAACAIGNPAPFLATLTQTAGGEPVASLVLRDHDPFEPRTIAELIRRASEAKAEFIVVTEKDWSKLSRFDAARWPCPVLRPTLELGFDRGEEELIRRLQAALAAGDADGHSLPA